MKHFLNQPTPILLSKNNPKIQTGPPTPPRHRPTFGRATIKEYQIP